MMMRAACAGVGGQDSTLAWPAGPPGRSDSPRSSQRTARRKAPLKMKWDLPDRRCREPHAGMRPAARCTRAPTESGDPHVPLAVAMVTAVPQLGIERVEHVGVKSGHLDRPDRRQDMPVDLPLVRTPRVRLDDRLAGGPPAAGATAVGPGAGARTPGRPSALTAHRTVPCARVDDKVALERAPDHLPAPTRRMFWHSVVHGRTARHEVGGAGAGLASRRDDDPGNRSGKSAGKGRSSS
jgi:hypothetical protein